MFRSRLALVVGGVCSCFIAEAGSHCRAEALAPKKPSVAEEQKIDPRVTPEMLAAFEPSSFEAKGMVLPYRLLRPLGVKEKSTEERKAYPLVLFMHGKGERGDDNWKQLVHGGQMFASDAFRQRYPAYVVAPQCPLGTEPGTVSKEKDVAIGTEADRHWGWQLERFKSPTNDLSREPTRQLAAVRLLVDKLREELPIDDSRIYVCGLSMGGYATWELAAREPDFWAAAIPICGAGDPNHAGRLARLPIWTLHGEADRTIPAERSREMVRAINAAGGRVIYTEYPDVRHASWVPTFGSRHVWDWMFAQRR